MWFFILYQQEHHHLGLKGEETGHSDDRMLSSGQFSQSCPTICNPMDGSTLGFPAHHQLPELTQLMSIELVMDLYNSTGKNGIRAQFSSVAQLCPTLCNPMDCSWLQIHISMEEKGRITEGSTNPGGMRHAHNSEDKASSHEDYSHTLKLNEIFSDGF